MARLVKSIRGFIKKHSPCYGGLEWLQSQENLAQAWEDCPKSGWLSWALVEVLSQKALDTIEKPMEALCLEVAKEVYQKYCKKNKSTWQPVETLLQKVEKLHKEGTLELDLEVYKAWDDLTGQYFLDGWPSHSFYLREVLRDLVDIVKDKGPYYLFFEDAVLAMRDYAFSPGSKEKQQAKYELKLCNKIRAIVPNPWK